MMKPCYTRGYGVWRVSCVQYLSTLSSIHKGHSEHTVKRRIKKPEGGCEEVQVPIPNSIYDYNRSMGGVDLSDQLIQYFETRRKAHKYWKTLFFHCIDICVTNAYILYRESLLLEERKVWSQNLFVTEFVKDCWLIITSPAHRPARTNVRAHHRFQYQETYYAYCAACKGAHATKWCYVQTRFSEWHSPSFDTCISAVVSYLWRRSKAPLEL